jgi:hypothetical protein
MEVPLEILDQEVARAAASLHKARLSLARGEAEAEDNPLEAHRRVSSRATYLDLLPPPKLAPQPGVEMAPSGHPDHPDAPRPSDPLRDALREWLYALTLERVLWADTVRCDEARRAESVQVEHADVARLEASPRELLVRALAEPVPQRARVYAEALALGAGAAADAARIYAERRAEAARRLPAMPAEVEIPAAPRTDLARIAEALLQRTAPLLPRDGRPWHAVLGDSVGRSLGEGWPARLTPRWLEDLFRGTGLTEGLRLELPELPAPIGASSFARALASFGAELAREDRPRRALFALARAPFDLLAARRAALFAGLTACPFFAARALGLGRGRARDQARAVANASVASIRILATRVLLRDALCLPDGARETRFEERTAEALGAPIPPALAGVVPRLAPGDAAALAGALLAARDRRSLVERFDEDWFRSPHAARALREEDGASVVLRRAPAADLDAGLDAMLAALESC